MNVKVLKAANQRRQLNDSCLTLRRYAHTCIIAIHTYLLTVLPRVSRYAVARYLHRALVRATGAAVRTRCFPANHGACIT